MLLTAALSLLSSLMIKAGEKGAETIGEKLAEKAVTKSFWRQIKGIFIKEEEKHAIEVIENKVTASSSEVAMIESKIKQELNKNPEFAEELRVSLNINPSNEFIAIEKIKSIQRLQEEIKKLEEQMERAGIATSGDYINVIESKQDKLRYQTSELIKILNS